VKADGTGTTRSLWLFRGFEDPSIMIMKAPTRERVPRRQHQHQNNLVRERRREEHDEADEEAKAGDRASEAAEVAARRGDGERHLVERLSGLLHRDRVDGHHLGGLMDKENFEEGYQRARALSKLIRGHILMFTARRTQGVRFT